MASVKKSPTRKPLSATYDRNDPRYWVVGAGRLTLKTARIAASTRQHARTWGDIATPVAGAGTALLLSSVGADPLGPLGPTMFESGFLDMSDPFRLTVGSIGAVGALMYERSDSARARRERRLVQKAFGTLGAGEQPTLLHPNGRPIKVELPTPTSAGSRVVMKVPDGLSDDVMKRLAPTLGTMLRGKVTIRPVPPPPTAVRRAKTKVVTTARRATPGAGGKPKSAQDLLLAYGHVQIDIRRKEVLREGVTWKHLAEMRRPGFKGLSVWDGWHVGVDEAGEDVVQHLVQRDKISGGVRGSGKSTGMHTDIAALALDPTARIILMDPSRFAEFGRWLPIAYAAAGTPEDCVELLEAVYADGLQRLNRMSELSEQRKVNGFDPSNIMKGETTTWLVIDELLALTNHPKREVRLRCQEILYAIVTQLRKVGFHLICSTLKPTGDVIPTNLRDNIIVRESFRCPVPEMSLAVLGDVNWVRMGFGGHAIDAGGPRGISYLLADGHPVRKAVAYLSEDERDEVLDVALRVRNLPALPPPPSAQEGITVTDLAFGDPSVAPGRQGASPTRESVTLAPPASGGANVTPVPAKAPTLAKAPVPAKTAAPVQPKPREVAETEEVDSLAEVLMVAARMAVEAGHLTFKILQARLGLDFEAAGWVLGELEERGVISPAEGDSGSRKALASAADLDRLLGSGTDEAPEPAPVDPAEAARAEYARRRRRPDKRTRHGARQPVGSGSSSKEG